MLLFRITILYYIRSLQDHYLISLSQVFTNRISANGISANGISANGISANGISVNGVLATLSNMKPDLGL